MYKQAVAILLLPCAVAVLLLAASIEQQPSSVDNVGNGVDSPYVKARRTQIDEIITATTTAYNPVEGQTDSTPYTNAAGNRVELGTIACPSRYDFGTKVEIDNKIYVCEDRMAPRYRDGNYFDIFMWSEERAWNYGRQQKEVIIYK